MWCVVLCCFCVVWCGVVWCCVVDVCLSKCCSVQGVALQEKRTSSRITGLPTFKKKNKVFGKLSSHFWFPECQRQRLARRPLHRSPTTRCSNFFLASPGMHRRCNVRACLAGLRADLRQNEPQIILANMLERGNTDTKQKNPKEKKYQGCVCFLIPASRIETMSLPRTWDADPMNSLV